MDEYRAPQAAGRCGRKNDSKTAIACDRCRRKKVKCDGLRPCITCLSYGTECDFSSRKARTARVSDRERRTRGHSRHAVRDSRVIPPYSQPCVAPIVHDDTCTFPQTTLSTEAAQQPSEKSDRLGGLVTVGQSPFSISSPIRRNTSGNSLQEGAVVSHGDLPQARQGDAQLSCLPRRDEYQGPSSCFSVCCEPALSWIANRVGATNCTSELSSLMYRVGQTLKLSRPLSNERMPEPLPALAWKFSQAYFDESFEATFYTIDRRSFESRLRTHEKDSTAGRDDPVWYALRNIVYAYGSRSVLCKRGSWAAAQQHSWRYFENALSVETDLLHSPSDLSTIRVLLAMAFFVEGAGCVKLEYMLIGNALRLAQAKGLHLRPPRNTKLTSEEVQIRSWLFWTIYFYEKHITLRSGRPSAIDDDDITCEIPDWSPDGNSSKVEIFRCMVQHAMISSAIIKNLTTGKARQQSAEQLAILVMNLDERLRIWYEAIPPAFHPSVLDGSEELPDGIRKEHIQYLLLAYYGSLTVIHSVLAYPWNFPYSPRDSGEFVNEEAESSTSVLAEASRKIISATRCIQLTPSAPTWLILYFPLVGAINLFISILKAPTGLTAPGDVAMLDMAAGYFGYLTFTSESKLSFPFLNQIANWARATISKTAETLESSSLPTLPVQDLGFVDFGDLGPANEFAGVEANEWDFQQWPSSFPFPV